MQSHLKLALNIFIAVSAAIVAGCSGNNGKETIVAENQSRPEAQSVDLRGQWLIENIVFSDSDYVRPDEVAQGAKQYIVFDDSTYYIMTNCNSISGTYTMNGDSITLGDGAMTEMACDNMDTENALRRILPRISTIDVQNDTVVRLNGTEPAECILLRKAIIELK